MAEMTASTTQSCDPRRCELVDLEAAIPPVGAEPGSGQGSSATVAPEDGGEKDKDEEGCHPCAFLISLPFLLFGIILWPFGMLFKLLSCLCCLCPACSCCCKICECIADLPCNIYKCFKKCIPC
eukprot:TRINITY_DN440_c0_g1_i3.p3 TRINITY_DN440_c0_g1~~TRINITY_DN440_c0_g1_i3.p3  ORF type:complete len:124 (-),score=25.20 TRINITY_DN440_c0_g1_i3:532-903(-)